MSLTERMLHNVRNPSGNAWPWKHDEQLPPDFRFLNASKEHVSLESQEGQVDLILADSLDRIDELRTMLSPHGKIYFRTPEDGWPEIITTLSQKYGLHWAGLDNIHGGIAEIVLRPRRQLPQPEWSPAHHGAVLVHDEWGWGDFIMNFRYTKTLHELGNTVIVEARKGMASLVQQSKWVTATYTQGDALPPFDYRIECSDLPKMLTNVPPTPYFVSNAPRLNGFNIGVVWAGHPLTLKRSRFIDPARFEPLTKIAKIWNLKKNPDVVPEFMETPPLDNWATTASVVSQMDLVLTIDTSMAHLAGAMNKSVWVIMQGDNRGSPLYRKNINRWYPTLRIIEKQDDQFWDSIYRMLIKTL